MNEIKCPNCGEIFEIDESKYLEIVAQVRNEQYNKDVAEKLADLKREQEAILTSMMSEVEIKHNQDLAEKEKEIARLQEQAKNAETVQKQAIEAVEAKAETQRQKELEEKERKILELEAQAKQAATLQQLAVSQAVEGKTAEIIELKAQVQQVKNEAEIREMTLKDAHKLEVKLLQDELAESRDRKMRLSTKLLGEDLEQHMWTVFNQHRDSFPNASFGKDNEVVEGTKGDFIYREMTDDGIEVVSIMFEMKNEADDTVKKHKNTEFLAKLDKDRQKKGCEYAVLVTMLEPESELYNEGIVSSWDYEKMFIIRPQFFIPLIKILRKAALANMDARRELMVVQRENLDVQKFDATLADFKEQFGKNCGLAQKHFDNTIKEINEVIKHLEKVRGELELTGKQMGFANNKLQDLTIKNLTKGNIGMQQKFIDGGVSID